MQTANKTKKRYTIIFQCVDPPMPVIRVQSDNLGSLSRMFDKFVASEKEEYHDSGLRGGEWTLTLYEHTSKTSVVVYKTDMPEYFSDGKEHIYAISYPGSHILREFSYMDLGRS